MYLLLRIQPELEPGDRAKHLATVLCNRTGGKLSGSIQVGDNSGCRTPCQGNSMTQAVPQSRCKAIQASKANAVPDCLSDFGADVGNLKLPLGTQHKPQPRHEPRML